MDEAKLEIIRYTNTSFFSDHIHRRLQDTVFIGQVVDIKRFPNNEMFAQEGVANLPFGVFGCNNLEPLVAQIFLGAFAVGLPADLQGVAHLQVIRIDSVAVEVARAAAFQKMQVL